MELFMAEYTKPLNIAYSPQLNAINSLENPLISKEIVYQFLDKSEEYHNNGGHVTISPELQKEFDLAFPDLNIKERYRPDNEGWYHKKLEEKVKKLNNLDYKDDIDNDKSHIKDARQQRAAHMMNLINKVLLENDIEPGLAQELSFNAVSKALDKNPNLILNNELDVKSSQEITDGLKPGIKRIKPKPSDDDEDKDNKFKGRKDLTEENAKELQAYMSNQMLIQLEQYNRSRLLETATHDQAHYKEMAFNEASMDNANTSIGLKDNIRALRPIFTNRSTQEKKKHPPTPMDDLLDPLNGKK